MKSRYVSLLSSLYIDIAYDFFFFFSSRRRHTRSKRDWSSDVCSSDLKPALLETSRVHFRLGRPEEALAFAQRALDRGPLRARTLYLLGRIHAALKSPDRAKKSFEEALALVPEDQKLRADLLLELKRVEGGKPR